MAKPRQFRLRTLFAIISLCAVLSAALATAYRLYRQIDKAVAEDYQRARKRTKINSDAD